MRIIEIHNESSQKTAQDPVSEIQLQLTRESAHRGKPGMRYHELSEGVRILCPLPQDILAEFLQSLLKGFPRQVLKQHPSV